MEEKGFVVHHEVLGGVEYGRGRGGQNGDLGGWERRHGGGGTVEGAWEPLGEKFLGRTVGVPEVDWAIGGGELGCHSGRVVMGLDGLWKLLNNL